MDDPSLMGILDNGKAQAPRRSGGGHVKIHRVDPEASLKRRQSRAPREEEQKLKNRKANRAARKARRNKK